MDLGLHRGKFLAYELSSYSYIKTVGILKPYRDTDAWRTNLTDLFAEALVTSVFLIN